MDEANVIDRVTALQTRYIRALDRRDMKAWADCFGEVGSYVCISRENEEQGLPLAIMMDDSRARIEDRITYVTRTWAGTFEDYWTRHFLQPINCSLDADGLVSAESNFMVAYTSAKGQSEILVAGAYHDRIELGGDNAWFRARKAVLDTITTPRYLVYPI